MSRRPIAGTGLFSLLLRLYPPAFRETFEEEILEVLAEKFRDEQRIGALSQIRYVLRELEDLAIGAAVENLSVRFGMENPMTNNIRRFRFFIILSPVILAASLLVINPRYVLRIFSDLLGWEILLAVVLGLCIGLLLYFAPEPKDMPRRLREEFALVILFLMTNLLIIVGPALVMVFGSNSTINTPAGECASILRWILLGLIGLLALIAAAMAGKRVHTTRGQAG
jgi:hypothetical protein